MSFPARNSDPETSREAAAAIIADGTRDSMQRTAIECVRQTPGKTAAELQSTHTTVTGAIWKRLSEVERQGHVARGEKRKCSVTGKNAMTWWPVVEVVA